MQILHFLELVCGKNHSRLTNVFALKLFKMTADEKDLNRLVWFRLVLMYGISTIVGYSVPNTFYSYKQFYFKQFSLA